MTAHARRHLLSSVLLVALSLLGCQQVSYGSESDDYDDWRPPDMAWGDDDEDDPSETTPPPGETDEGPDDPPKLDVPPGNPPGAECSVVDLLFVIDNSNSMSAEQANLIASFDGFISGIQANLDEANDYHVGVVTTDAYAFNPLECQTLGALVTQTPAGVCGPWAEGPFISLADDLASSFTCAADVGVDGSTDEHQIEAALRAISPALGGPGACNEGFFRDDALLVLVVISDEDDGTLPGQGSPGEPDDWFAEIVTRVGVESNVVVLALTGVNPPNACDANVPFEGAQIAYRIRQFVQHFTYGAVGDVCADDYAGFFDAALDDIHDACINFTPEG